MRDSQQRQRSDFTGCDFFIRPFFDITSQFENVLRETPPPPKRPNDVVGEKIDMFAAPYFDRFSCVRGNLLSCEDLNLEKFFTNGGFRIFYQLPISYASLIYFIFHIFHI